jgi:hypothetical protein
MQLRLLVYFAEYTVAKTNETPVAAVIKNQLQQLNRLMMKSWEKEWRRGNDPLD